MYRVIDRRRTRKVRKMGFWRKHKSDLSKPRLCVFRSAKHIQVQLFNDVKGHVVVAASSMEKELRSSGLTGKKMAERVGQLVAERAVKAGVTSVVFDRNGYTYHGRVQVLADAARGAGLKF